MGDQDAFERILASLYGAMLDDARWPGTSALIDEACALTGNDLIVSEGPKDDLRVLFVGAYCRGQRREDQERDYLENYHPTDERVPRFRRLPDSRLVHVKDLFTAEELKTSPTYNEMLLRTGGQDSMNARLDGPDSCSITWGLRDPVASDGWGSARVAMVKGLLPHIRQFVRVRQALVRAEARNTTVTALLDNPRVGVLHLDRRGRIIDANGRARSILRHGDGCHRSPNNVPYDQLVIPRVMWSSTLIDEIGYLPIDRQAATLFFQLISRRYERGPMILTSNQSFGSWGDVFGDRVIASAILDRDPASRDDDQHPGRFVSAEGQVEVGGGQADHSGSVNDGSLWTLAARWTRRRAHNALDRPQTACPQPPQALLSSMLSNQGVGEFSMTAGGGILNDR